MAFADKYRKSGGGSATGVSTGFTSRYRKNAQGAAPLGAWRDEMKLRIQEQEQQKRAEEEKKRIEEQVQKQQEAIAQFQAKQEEVRKQAEEGGIFGKAKALYQGVKSWLGRGETLPEIEGGSSIYQAERQSQLVEQDYRRNLGGRLAWGAEELAGKTKEYIGKKKEEFEKSKEERGIVGTQIEELKGGAKNLAELASGAGKTALEFSPLTGMSGIRKISKFVGGKKVEELLDRNSPEYQKKVDAFLDENGILNYKANYANEIQKTGGEVAEIGSWFIPITRAGKAEKIEKVIAEIPRVAKILGATPKVVKVGGKLMYEVSKDVVDVAVLDQLRGKSWEETKEDLKAVAVGGTALRGTGLLAGGLAGKLKSLKQNKIAKSLENAIPDMDDAEKKLALELAREGKPVDDIATDIFSKREQAGKDIYRQVEKIKSEATEKSKNLLPEGKTPKETTGAGFIMKEKATSFEIKRAKVFSDYEAKLKAYNKNPTKNNLESVVNAKKEKDLFIEGKVREIGKLKTREVPIKNLNPIEGDRELAMADFEAGKKSRTKLPVLAKEETDGTFTILDGNGRIIEAEKAGKETIKITTDEALYRKLTEEKSESPVIATSSRGGKRKSQPFGSKNVSKARRTIGRNKRNPYI